MQGTGLSDWIANNDRATQDWPLPLGHYAGFRIARGCYERATDKKEVLRELILLKNPEDLLNRSGWLD